jgi:hypothetical protein
VLVKLAALIATVITGGFLYNQNNVGFQAVDKIINETKDLIKGNNNTECKDGALRVKDDFKKVLVHVSNIKRKVHTLEHLMYHFMKVTMDKQDGGVVRGRSNQAVSKEIWVTGQLCIQLACAQLPRNPNLFTYRSIAPPSYHPPPSCLSIATFMKWYIKCSNVSTFPSTLPTRTSTFLKSC